MPIIQAFHFHHSIKTRKADSVQLYLNYPKSVQLPDPTAAPIKMALPRLVASRLSNPRNAPENHGKPSFSNLVSSLSSFFFSRKGRKMARKFSCFQKWASFRWSFRIRNSRLHPFDFSAACARKSSSTALQFELLYNRCLLKKKLLMLRFQRNTRCAITRIIRHI